MNSKIMARLRGGVPTHRIIFDGNDLPDLGLDTPLNIDHAREYTPAEGPEGDFELYYVELDEEQKEKMVDPYIDAVRGGAEPIAQVEYNAVNAVYKISGRRLVLSRVNSSARIGEDGKTLIKFSEKSISLSKLSFSIELSGDVDAYYDGMDRIYFSKFARAKGLFRDFGEFYQEAWYDDKESFLDTDIFAVSEMGPDDIGPSETRQIAEIRNNYKLDLEDKDTVAKIQDYVRKYPLSGVLLNTDGRIKIATKDDLKCTIKLLTQRYYTSEITGEVLEARGSETMKNQKAKKIMNGVEVSGRSDIR
jgi:hypothetical protein